MEDYKKSLPYLWRKWNEFYDFMLETEAYLEAADDNRLRSYYSELGQINLSKRELSESVIDIKEITDDIRKLPNVPTDILDIISLVYNLNYWIEIKD